MPRQARKESGTGIYHVMLRGINRQDIFEDREDYVRMLGFLQQMLEQFDEAGNRQPPLCTFYAYCLMSNHVHLLLRTNQKDKATHRLRQVAQLAPKGIHSFRRMHAVGGQFGEAQDFSVGPVPTERTQLADKLPLRKSALYDDVLSDVRQMAVTNNSSSVFRTCFID